MATAYVVCMGSEVPVTEARARFAELVNRVGYGHERITLTKHGKPLVTLVPADSTLDDEHTEGTVLDLASTATPSTAHSYSLVARGPQAPQGGSTGSGS